MTAKQLQYFGKRRARRSSSRARRGGRGRVVIVSANPKRRHRRRRLRAMARVVRRRFRRNPAILGTSFLTSALVPAAFGAGGALAVDWMSNNLPIPTTLRTPTLQPVVNIGLSLLAGWGVSLLAGRQRGADAAAGGIIVALYNFANQQIYQPGGMLNFMGGSPYAAASPAGTGSGLNRYVGFVRRNPRLGMPFGPGPAGPRVATANPLAVRSQLSGPSAFTKFRMMRNGAAGGRLGYTGPARTLGRYMSR
jgi:hypothetical protein